MDYEGLAEIVVWFFVYLSEVIGDFVEVFLMLINLLVSG